MMPSVVIKPIPVVLPDSLRWTRWSCLVTLVSGALTFALRLGSASLASAPPALSPVHRPDHAHDGRCGGSL